MDQWIVSAHCLPSPRAEELSGRAARVLHPLSVQLLGISVQFDLLSWMSCWSVLEGSALVWVKALEREQWFKRDFRLLLLALGKTIYLKLVLKTLQPLIFLSYCFELYLLWRKIEEVALNVSLNTEQQALDWYVWIAEGLKWQQPHLWVLKPLEGLSVTLFTLPNVPEAHLEANASRDCQVLTCLQCNGVKSTWDLPCCWKSWVGGQAALKGF